MIRTKTFSTQLKIFHTRNELNQLDKEIAEFISKEGIQDVISVSDATTTGEKGETIGLIRTITYVDPAAEKKEQQTPNLRRVS